MGSVRTGSRRPPRVLHRRRCPRRAPGTRHDGAVPRTVETHVLDIVYLLTAAAVLALTACLGKAVERL
ncbi:hypothetical protein SAMN05216467_0386 [Cellulomonas sp. KH9]|nr:hypothetical protein SAMN05216467_0386 [Cellulomonas sp. KH9]